jgi:hypothetical protein
MVKFLTLFPFLPGRAMRMGRGSLGLRQKPGLAGCDERSAMGDEAAKSDIISGLLGIAGGQGQSGRAGSGGLLATVFQDISQTVARTMAADRASGATRSGDRYVTGDVHWDGYGLKPLIRMVADQANPAQVEAVADLWRTHGAAVGESADNLTRSLNTLMEYWQGAAAAKAAESVTRNANWITDVGATATRVAGSIEDASGALRSAQSTMPGAPSSGFFAGFGSAAGGAAAGALIGGPFGAAAGAVIGGLASAFGFGSSEKKLKRQAVQTMQRYEQAALGIDTATATFAAPTAGVAGDPDATGTTGVGSGSGVGALPVDAVAGATTPGAGLGDFQSTTPSFASGATARWDSLTGGGGGGFGGGAGGLGAGGGAGFGSGFEAGIGGAGFGAAGRFAGSAAAIEEEERLAGRGGSSVLEEAERPGSTMPYGQGGRSGRKEEDREHRRRIPFEDEPFVTGMKTAPAVIGLVTVDREETE